MTPVMEIRLILNERGGSWEYVAESHGRMIAASDGDAIYSTPGAALVACVAEVKAGLPSYKGSDDGR